MKKRVAVLGATGSIGRQTLDVLRKMRDRFEPVLFAARKNRDELVSLKKEFPAAVIALSSADSAGAVDFSGEQGLLEAIAAAKPDITVNGITGAAGLLPSVAAIEAGSDLALANKESAVMAGSFIFALAAEKNVRIIPVDSEHTAILKLLKAHGRENTREIILTASGGPFRSYPKEKLAAVTPAAALAHPTWNMGPKITVDSATLANKGLEVIEAAVYFGFPPENIKVVVHPQSVVHSMIRLNDGAVYAQMSKPDMRLTIHDALTWPETEYSPFGVLDFDALTLSFEKPDFERFPMLALAYQALRGGALAPCVYNAANEKAVEAFLAGEISFLEIPRIVGYVLSMGFLSGDKALAEGAAPGIETVLETDKKARELAGKIIAAGADTPGSYTGAV